MWLAILSDQLPVIGLVGNYPTNYLIGRGLILKRKIFTNKLLHLLDYLKLPHLSVSYVSLKGRFPRVTQPFAAAKFLYCYANFTARLAYLRHVASVNPEPGSDSPYNSALTIAETIE